MSPEDITEEAGWLASHRRRGARALVKLSATAEHPLEPGAVGSRAPDRKPRALQPLRRQNRAPRQPHLPSEDIKIVLRPRTGLDVTKVSHAGLRDGVLRATGLTHDEAVEDLLRINSEKNIIVASTPSMQRAQKYDVKALHIGGKMYEVTAYAAPPEDTVKGVIHNIPDYDSAADITNSLVYKKNPTILQARRMGRTNSVLIVFEGKTVPHYIYYRGAEYRCFLHKKRHEICGGCGRLGHRVDVCPAPGKKICKLCGEETPGEDHPCTPKCALCGKDHATGDKKCPLRYQTPYVLKKRKWDKQRRSQQQDRQQQQHGNTDGGNSSSILKFGGALDGYRDCSTSFPGVRNKSGRAGENTGRQTGTRDTSAQGRIRSRSSSRHRQPSKEGRSTQRRPSRSTSRGGERATDYNHKNKVSWAATVSHGTNEWKGRGTPAQNICDLDSNSRSELTRIRQMLEMVLLENRALKAELARLKGSPAPTNHAYATDTAEQPPQATGSADPVAAEFPEPTSASAMDITGSSDPPVASEIVERNSGNAMGNTSPPPKRRATESQPENQTAPPGPDSPIQYVTQTMLQTFGQQLSETLCQNLNSKFDNMLAKFADTIDAKIASQNARVTALENASLRPMREGGAGPIKPTKPYFRPPSADSFKNPADHA